MALEDWIVRNRTGEPLGAVRKLILDSRTKEISYADVALARSETLIRVPWKYLVLDANGIVLDGTMDEIAALSYLQAAPPSSAAAPHGLLAEGQS